MRNLVFTQGRYGERILENIRARAPQDWEIHQKSLPAELPPIVEDPEGFIEGLNLSGEWDLVLFLGESQSAFSIMPAIIEQVSTKAIIAPVDDYSWMPLGLERQIRSELEDKGISAVFPRTFCALGFVGVQPIDEFACYFGSPRLKLEAEKGVVKSVEVLRGAPCGSTWFMAEKLYGSRVDEAGQMAATLVQIYPCLASRRVDRLFEDAPIHVAGHIAKKAVEEALEGR